MKKDGAFVVIFNKKRDKVLLVKRRDFPVWVLPGGQVEEGESAKEAAVREVKEEAGIKVMLVRKVASYISSSGRNTILYEGKKIWGKMTTSSESEAVSYFPVERLPVTLLPSHEDRIKDALKGNRKARVNYSARNYNIRLISLIFKNAEWRGIFLTFLKNRFYGTFRIFKKI